MDVATVDRWRDQFATLWDQVGVCFSRRDLRSRAESYVRGLLGPVQRKNSWQVAEHVGAATPHGLQRLLGRARWDADVLRDEVRRYAVDHLLAEGEVCDLIVDETGFLKKGEKSAGVQRQYSGTAGRIENCQVGVFLALRGSRGHALIDRELYLPKGWCEDAERREEAGIPSSVTFATKPQLARNMIRRTLDALGGTGVTGGKPRWVLADEVYGSDSKVRRFLESRRQPYVLAVTSQQRLWVDMQRQRVDRIADDLPADQWFRMNIANGSKGPRIYDWAAGRFGIPTETGLIRWLLIRRSVDDVTDRAYYLCAAPPDATAGDLAIAAGRRWSIEICFETAKQEVGLDEYEVRSWVGWYRHITLSMLAMSFLASIRAQTDTPTEKGGLIWSR